MLIDTIKFHNQLLRWFDKHQREMPWRQSRDPYFIWISEVMLQQTQVQTVIPYFQRFITQFPTVQSLAEADLNRILKTWEGLGYYSRARNLAKAAKIVVEEHKSKIPDNSEDFIKLPGVGEYIAAAVQSIAFNAPLAAVDGNVKRVLARLLLIDHPINQSQSHKTFNLEAEKLLNSSEPGRHNEAMMELGALVCTPINPDCSACPIKTFCKALTHKLVKKYPKRKKKPAVPIVPIAVGVIFKGDKMLITRRKEEGLLGGLWEFPGGKIRKDESAKDACLREVAEETNLKIEIITHLTRVKHAYSHFKIEMDVFVCRYISGKVRLFGPVDHQWIIRDEIDNYPFPKANIKFMSKIKSLN